MTSSSPTNPDSPDLVVRRSRQAKRLLLRVDPRTGAAVLTLPWRVPLAEGHAFVARHEGWIARARAALPPSTALTAGSVVPILGTDITIRHDPAAGRRPQYDPTAGTLTLGGELSELPNRVRRFLRQFAADLIGPKTRAMASKANRPLQQIRIGDQKSRWGSCTSDGVLSFSWRLICAPETVVDYVIAHEVAHLIEMNHSPRFWAEVETLYGPHSRPRAWLKRYGASLQRIG
ncbi:M48 family metallopeptidase [Govanella unica]|uniref:M48 family metallopeptidase n=1 Tax=Govanella unica TaxID=2975056 RepID=A0A9X3TZA6_9PROT|nr:SprT family zinc-dependent metalloprotease [Govania unica]MDA5194485.1 M48 family metallopeptidase [Govania unica]